METLVSAAFVVLAREREKQVQKILDPPDLQEGREETGFLLGSQSGGRECAMETLVSAAFVVLARERVKQVQKILDPPDLHVYRDIN